MRARLFPRATMVAALVAAAIGIAAPQAHSATPAAPGAPGVAHTWAPGDKDGFGTSRSLKSKAWYTLNDGVLTEVFYPRIDTPSTRDTQLVVTDGKTFADREDLHTTHTVALADPKSLVYRQTNTAESGRYRITKTYVTDPARSAVLVDVRVESLTGTAYQVYVLHDPALSNTGDDDTGTSTKDDLLVAGDAQGSAALAARPAFTRTSSGYQGVSDGWTDLNSDFRMSWKYVAKSKGNVVQLGRTTVTGLQGAQRLTLAIGFGGSGDAAAATARTRRAFN